MARIMVYVKEPGKMLEARFIDNDLKSMQEIVGGHIELVRVGEGLDMWINEEGKYDENCKPNFVLNGDVILGNVFFAGHDEEGDTTDAPNNLDVAGLALRLEELAFNVNETWKKLKELYR